MQTDVAEIGAVSEYESSKLLGLLPDYILVSLGRTYACTKMAS